MEMLEADPGEHWCTLLSAEKARKPYKLCLKAEKPISAHTLQQGEKEDAKKQGCLVRCAAFSVFLPTLLKAEAS